MQSFPCALINFCFLLANIFYYFHLIANVLSKRAHPLSSKSPSSSFLANNFLSEVKGI